MESFVTDTGNDDVFFVWLHVFPNCLDTLKITPDKSITLDKMLFFNRKVLIFFLVSPRKHVVGLIRSASMRHF